MEAIKFELPALDEILRKLETIDAKLENALISKPQTEVWLNSLEASKALGVTKRTLASYKEQGVIPFSQYGRLVRYRASDIQEFLLNNQIKGKESYHE